MAFQLFFIIVYDLFLKNETFFNWNRAYLLGTTALSFVLPFIQIERFKNAVPQNFIITLPEVVLGQEKVVNSSATEIPSVLVESSLPLWELLFYLGVILALGLFLFKLTNILILIYKNPKTKVGKLKLVQLLKSTKAFSFFNYIFLGEHLNEKEKESILSHEIVHVKQNHTLDLLFFEVLRIVFWFNPLVYIYQNKIMALHEFIADSNAIKQQNKSEYYQNLLSQVFETKHISFINPFFKQSLIKKRIVMLQKSKSKQIRLLKYALLIPMVIGMLVYTSCSVQDKALNQNGNLDLSQYSYSIKDAVLKSGAKLNDETILAKKRQDNFLDANRTYVRWMNYDSKNAEVVYSVHSSNEKLPEGYEEVVGGRPDGTSLKMYVNFKNLPEIKQPKMQKKDIEKLKEEYKNALEVPFAVVDEVPIFPGCETLTSSEERKKCMSEKISDFVNRNFNTKIGTENGLTGRQRINVIFKINKEGDIVGVRSRAPHPALEAEAIRVIKSLPHMKPGVNNGKKVVVPYSLPIIFQVQDDVPLEKKE
ncbi:M56 family metallopeptidase [Yeosuana marina]|uniref:M56 family metallopeptidase n=1 Tax=Yeosuana marina TaxID=1565536 RepID=UPI001F10C0D4|nr:M56 family metallopeptidase [Yeosuana marina]